MNRLFAFAIILFMIGTLLTNWTDGWKIGKLQIELRTLATNNVHLIQMNEALSRGVSEVARVQLEKADFDRNVAEKVRELNRKIDFIYGLNYVKTNPVSGAIH